MYVLLRPVDSGEVEQSQTITVPDVSELTGAAELRCCSDEVVANGVRDQTSGEDIPRPKFGTWFNRPRRVLLTLAAVWVVAIFDLGYTLAESGTQDFAEANPVAAKLLAGPARTIVAYKFSMVGLATAILLALRRHAVAELGCWFLFALKVYVALRWYSYFDCVLHGYVNPLLRVLG